jgi:AmiR/NasT family two-component response regulator
VVFLAGRLGLAPDEAFLGLRQYARSHRAPLRDVAQAVIDGRLVPARTARGIGMVGGTGTR